MLTLLALKKVHFPYSKLEENRKHMVWILSLLLTGVLFAALLSIMFPQLLVPFIANRWRQSAHYRNNIHH
jgi:cytochrome bd-type quinol oxidase subunit 2